MHSDLRRRAALYGRHLALMCSMATAILGCRTESSDSTTTVESKLTVALPASAQAVPPTLAPSWEAPAVTNSHAPIAAGPIDTDPSGATHPGLIANKKVTKPATPPRRVVDFVVSDAAKAKQAQFDTEWANAEKTTGALSPEEKAARRADLKTQILMGQ